MEKLTTFINLQTDYGFKKIFGTPGNKKILIRFLNALLCDSITVNDVVYHNKEMLPYSEDGKRIIYDIYCTSQEEKHHFILEMQNIYEPPFEDRVLYYTAKAIANQGKSGWKYNLKPVISIFVMDFDFRHISKALIHDMQVADLSTGDVLTDKMRIMLLSLKQIEYKNWNECDNEIERLMYLIKNMDKLDKNSEIYKSKEYKEIFDAAETENMLNEEVVAYSQSLQKLHDIQSGLEYARQEFYNDGIEKGRAEGIAVGLEQGKLEGLRETARNLLKAGVDINFIHEITGLSIDEIQI